ncbi:MAG TPA: hypothetical protein PK733_19570 [Clostridiales bacterium]|nr:hypothetical protein [Clostridiales bacterium]
MIKITNLQIELNSIIAAYNALVKGIDEAALDNRDRAYGGIIRAGKGKLVESIARQLVRSAWCTVLNQPGSRLTMDKTKFRIRLKDDYINRMKEPYVKNYLVKNKSTIAYKFGTDVHVYIDGRLVIPIECKAYTENAMMKRILFDAALMQEAKGINKYYLLQLESQLGGDYCELNDITYGSPSTHTLISYFDVDLKIITLLKGERKVDQPIHKPEYYKPLTLQRLEWAANMLAADLKQFT